MPDTHPDANPANEDQDEQSQRAAPAEESHRQNREHDDADADSHAADDWAAGAQDAD